MKIMKQRKSLTPKEVKPKHELRNFVIPVCMMCAYRRIDILDSIYGDRNNEILIMCENCGNMEGLTDG